MEIKFSQYKLEEQIVEHKSKLLEIAYDKPLTWSIPQNTIFDRIELDLFDGRKVVYEAENETNLLNVSIDSASKSVLVTHNLKTNELQ